MADAALVGRFRANASGLRPPTLLAMADHHHEPPVDAAAQAAEWDARYGESDGARWSGRPNGRLVAEVAALAPGRALDAGCGEGADAIWLAEHGWVVTAVDVSEVALSARVRRPSEPG